MPARLHQEDYDDYELYDEPEEEELPDEAPEPHIELNAKLRSHARTLLIVLASMAMIITIRSGISASRGYTLVHTQQEAEALEQENERLKVEIAQLKSPQRIKDIATHDLGMTIPQQMYFVHAGTGAAVKSATDEEPVGQ